MPMRTGLGLNMDLCGDRPATTHISQGAVPQCTMMVHINTPVSKFSTVFTIECFHPTSDQHSVQWTQYCCGLICNDDRNRAHHSSSSWAQYCCGPICNDDRHRAHHSSSSWAQYCCGLMCNDDRHRAHHSSSSWAQYCCGLICNDDRHRAHHSSSSHPSHGYDTAAEITACGQRNILYNSLLLQDCPYGSTIRNKD